MPVLGPGSLAGNFNSSGTLVGDIILGARIRINDLPRTISAPIGLLTAAVVTVVGSTLPAATYYVSLTYFNRWGETTSIAEAGPFIVGANQGIQVQTPTTLPPGASGFKVYYGTGSGFENQWLSTLTVPFTISTIGYPGVPPTRNTSYYPDSDGQRVSTFTLYGWLNKALDIATNISGGIPDMTCMATILNQTMYQLIGTWNKFDHGWVDGYVINLGGRNTLFYRNVVPGVVRVGVLQQVSNKFIIELQPQPNRGGGVTTAAVPIQNSDTSITVASVAGFLLPFGMALIGNPPDPAQCEVISFSTINGNVLGGVVRGMGGTVQQSWVPGTPIVEGNIRLTGMRSFVAPNYQPGMSLAILSVPSGWSMPLEDFIVARYRESENNIQEATRLMTGFEKMIRDTLMGNKLVAGPRQVGLPGEGGMDTVPGLGGLGGGIILP